MRGSTWIYQSVIFLFLCFGASDVSIADCRGCCSHHGGVTCSNSITQCRDGSPLSAKCEAKGCGKCSAPRKSSERIKSRKSKPDQAYSRRLYRHWVDEDGDCQNTRHEVLIMTSQVEPKFKTPRHCIVIQGKWVEPYSGEIIIEARHIDIDHVVPLNYAHKVGAKDWSAKKRQQFANDLENLIPVSARENRKKGAKPPTEWMPPNQSYRCEYLKRWTKITRKYKLNEPQRSLASVNQMMDQACKVHDQSNQTK